MTEAAPPSPRPGRRLPLLLPGMISLLAGMYLGLVRLAWEVPTWARLVTAVHGPLMVGGFLGTLIGLERAVALGRPWAYAAPLLTGLAAILLIAMPTAPCGPATLLLGALAFLVVALRLWRLQPSLHSGVMALGGVLLAAAAALWLARLPFARIVLWWAAFPVLTIAGERLELNRVLPPSPRARALFRAIVAGFVLGLLVSLAAFDPGVRLAWGALGALGAWLLVNDVARRTVRAQGLTRYIAVCLLAGHAWLAFAGVLGAVLGGVLPGPSYDAMLHSLFLGFVLSMILGHAPVIFPAVLGWPVPYRRWFYGPLVLLHASLIARVTADLAWWIPVRQWAGLVNVIAVLGFLAGTLAAVVSAQRARGAGPTR